jgi:HAD domain in Swiss Army Knife RNA repair proteins
MAAGRLPDGSSFLPSRVLFLDIDGVLVLPNSVNGTMASDIDPHSHCSEAFSSALRTLNSRLMRRMRDRSSEEAAEENENHDPSLPVGIVLSTTWRLLPGPRTRVERFLRAAGLVCGGSVDSSKQEEALSAGGYGLLGFTALAREPGQSRADEIVEWVRKYEEVRRESLERLTGTVPDSLRAELERPLTWCVLDDLDVEAMGARAAERWASARAKRDIDSRREAEVSERVHSSLADGSSRECDACRQVVSAKRWEIHRTKWCPVLSDDVDPDLTASPSKKLPMESLDAVADGRATGEFVEKAANPLEGRCVKCEIETGLTGELAAAMVRILER